MLYPVIPSEMDTNIKIVEKIDPWTILGTEIKKQETNRFLPIMGDKDVDSFLETCRNQLRSQSERQNCVPNDCLATARRHKCWTGLLMSRVVSTDRVETSTELK